MPYASRSRTRRLTASVAGGEQIRDCLLRYRKDLISEAEKGDPPIQAVGDKLLAAVGPQIMNSALAKQLAGRIVAEILAAEGYQLVRHGVRVRDPLFRTGAVFEKRSGAPIQNEALLRAFLDALGADELRWVHDYAASRLKR